MNIAIRSPPTKRRDAFNPLNDHEIFVTSPARRSIHEPGGAAESAFPALAMQRSSLPRDFLERRSLH